MNNLRIWSQKGGPLLASSFRGSEVIGLEERNGRIEIADDADPAPLFYIDLKERLRPDLQEVEKEKRADAEDYSGDYFPLLRNLGKI